MSSTKIFSISSNNTIVLAPTTGTKVNASAAAIDQDNMTALPSRIDLADFEKDIKEVLAIFNIKRLTDLEAIMPSKAQYMKQLRSRLATLLYGGLGLTLGVSALYMLNVTLNKILSIPLMIAALLALFLGLAEKKDALILIVSEKYYDLVNELRTALIKHDVLKTGPNGSLSRDGGRFVREIMLNVVKPLITLSDQNKFLFILTHDILHIDTLVIERTKKNRP